MVKTRFYVVWQGTVPGIYTSWDDCRQQVAGVKGAVYKSFATRAEAEEAFARPATDYVRLPGRRSATATETGETEPTADATPEPARTTDSKASGAKRKTPARHNSAGLPPDPPDYRHDTVLPLPPEVEADALAVDAACSGNPGQMEYRGVYLATGQEVFHYGPVYGTNNIGEFLAIVHGLALLKQRGRKMTVYTDSRNALLWVKARKCRTTLARNARTEALYRLIERAENWLRANGCAGIPLKKWETSKWGEIPADFGRK